MADIIAFRPRPVCVEDEDIDLRTAVDTAIRDLRDILERWGEESSRLQAEECRLMLERVFYASV